MVGEAFSLKGDLKMKHQLRSSFSTQGRRMAGARALWTANGMKKEQMGKPIIAIVNSFTQFVPGHVHLHEIGQLVKGEIEKLGCFAAEFNTIAIDDGIAMGHDGMLYSLPSRDIIADSVEYMVNAHKADAMVCISNCDKITPGMLMAAMRLNMPTVFVSGGPMEAGEWNGQHLDLIDAMIKSADESVGDKEVAQIEQHACPTCGCCSGMFTANSMNCLNEAIGLALPGNGTIVATHENRKKLFEDAAKLIVENAFRYYEEGDESVLPRSIATREAFLNAMTLDIAMGGSTNTVLHLLAVAHEAGTDFKMDDIDMLSRKTPCLCKVAPNTQKYHVQDVNRAGGIIAIMDELAKGGLVDTNVRRVDGMTLAEAINRYSITSPDVCKEAIKKYSSAAAGKFNLVLGSQHASYQETRYRPCDRLYPRFGTCIQQGWRSGGFEGKYSSGRLRCQNCRCRREYLEIYGTGEGFRLTRCGLRRYSGWKGGQWRRRRHHSRGPERRTEYAGDALSYFLYQIPPSG